MIHEKRKKIKMLGFFRKFFKVCHVWWTVSISMRGGTSNAQKPVWWYKYFCIKITVKHRPWTVLTVIVHRPKIPKVVFMKAKNAKTIPDRMINPNIYVLVYDSAHLFMSKNVCPWFDWYSCKSVTRSPSKFWTRRSVFGDDFHTEILIPPDGFLCIRGPAAHCNWNRPSNTVYFEKKFEKSQHFDLFSIFFPIGTFSVIFRKI